MGRQVGIKLRDTSSFSLPGLVRVSVQPPVAQDTLHKAGQQLMKASQCAQKASWF
jgi:histidinol-phosphate aminotransferase